MKFKILPKVDGFRLKGVMYKPGDVRFARAVCWRVVVEAG